MKNYLIIVFFLVSLQFFAQNDQKTAFQKNKYDLAVSYYKKDDFVKAIDLFSLAAKVKPGSEIAHQAIQKVDTLREVLRKKILDVAVGTWKKSGNKPVWSSSQINNNSNIDELIEIKKDEILFYQLEKSTQTKKLIRTESLIYNDANNTVSLFSEIILSDGSIWNCSINEKATILHVINVAKKTEAGIEKIESDNEESYYVKI